MLLPVAFPNASPYKNPGRKQKLCGSLGSHIGVVTGTKMASVMFPRWLVLQVRIYLTGEWPQFVNPLEIEYIKLR